MPLWLSRILYKTVSSFMELTVEVLEAKLTDVAAKIMMHTLPNWALLIKKTTFLTLITKK
jgi:hypothetical protein